MKVQENITSCLQWFPNHRMQTQQGVPRKTWGVTRWLTMIRIRKKRLDFSCTTVIVFDSLMNNVHLFRPLKMRQSEMEKFPIICGEGSRFKRLGITDTNHLSWLAARLHVNGCISHFSSQQEFAAVQFVLIWSYHDAAYKCIITKMFHCFFFPDPTQYLDPFVIIKKRGTSKN